MTAQWRTLVGRATDMTLAPGSAMRRRSPRACSLLEEREVRLRFHPLQMGEMAHGRLAFSWPACTGCLPPSESIEISSLHQLAGLKRPRISRIALQPQTALRFGVSYQVGDPGTGPRSRSPAVIKYGHQPTLRCRCQRCPSRLAGWLESPPARGGL